MAGVVPPIQPHNGSLPIIKRKISGDEPPAHGVGLRLAVYQGPGLCGDRKAIEYNLSNLKKWAKSAAAEKAQLLAVGELFLSGYNVRPEDRDQVSIKLEEVMEMITPIAIENNIALVVPYAEQVDDSDRMFDSMLFVDAEGNLLKNYRKCQLWGTEERTVWKYPYTSEEEKDTAFEVKAVNGIQIGLLNCYEAEFPELSRILALKGAQVVLIPTAADVGVYDHHTKLWSNWAYPDVSKTIIPANAYQNRMFCSYINHSLYQFRSDCETLSGIYLGNSTVADPMGQTMVLAENVETMLIADCIPSEYPPTHPGGQSDFVRDRRPELYGQLVSKTVIHNEEQVTHTYPTDANERED